MLLNVTHDKVFQQFLDRREQELHVAMTPILASGIRRGIQRGSNSAQELVHKRGQKVLLAHYKRVYREVFGSIDRIIEKQDTQDINDFMAAQLDYIQREAANKISTISQSLMEMIRDFIFRGVQQGWSNNQIGRELYSAVPEMSRDRAAVIARTETHNAAMDAMDESLDYKEIEILTKQWWTAQDARVRPSHQAMHGVTVPRDQPFDTEDGQCMYPGDDSMGIDPGGVINCRCTVLYQTA